MSENIPAGSIPERPSLEGIEEKWEQRWETDGTYKFDRTKTRDQIYSIDTPPPTVSGSLHLGSAWSYTQTDIQARFWRMRGKEVFYPMGWDDNGLPTERRVQNVYGVSCDPALPYDPDFEFPEPVTKKGERKPIALARGNFVELCLHQVAQDEVFFEALFRRLALSVDWTFTYSSIDKRAQRASQRAFLRNLKRGEAYIADAPTMWDVDFQTAVAQAEMEDREVPAAYHRLAFTYSPAGKAGPSDEIVPIDTTRPELLAACVGVAVHPDDKRYVHLHGKEVTTALFGAKVSVQSHHLADPEKGSGAVMVCTFGDMTDVLWWRTFNWPARTIIQRNGRLGPLDWSEIPCVDPVRANGAYKQLEGLKAKPAQDKIVELLRESGELIGDIRKITHPVKFYEKGDKPLEIVGSRQWFIKIRDIAGILLERGQELNWMPPYMRVRFEDWVNGLNSDWLISRQRYSGVGIPVWYQIDADGEVQYDNILVPDESRLPIDPFTDVPEGFTEEQRNKPNGFAGDPDIFDTWMTSSLTPQIATGWAEDEDLHNRTYPMNVRPQAHEIIRTWLFYTVVRAQYEGGVLPWKNATISGWVVDNDRKKMSKSKGNVVTPMALLEEFGTDSFRYWAASARLGVDTTFEINQVKVGRRLSIKLLNASKFVLSFPKPAEGAVATYPVDIALLARLAGVVEDATAAFEAYDYTRALERIEQFFWSFCDDYLELVKGRAYGAQGDDAAVSANATLRATLDTTQRLFAPFLPFSTEEVWSWWHEGSVHRASWPQTAELSVSTRDDSVLTAVAATLSEVRRAKSEAKVSVRTAVASATVIDTAANIQRLLQAQDDLKEAGTIEELVLIEGRPSISVELAATISEQ